MTLCGHTLLRRMMSLAFKLWELYAACVWQLECDRISREFEGEVLMKSGSMANQRAQFIADQRTLDI